MIANYVDWSPERNFYCGDHGPGMRSYCHPDDFHGQPPTLYHNNGDGTFTDVSKSSGIGLKGGNGLGVVTFDYDNDGWQDIFIANDHMPNFSFTTTATERFVKLDISAGVAVSADGQFEAGMGTDAADITGNGRMDLIVTHLDMQLARVYQNLGDQTFDDATFAPRSGLCDVPHQRIRHALHGLRQRWLRAISSWQTATCSTTSSAITRTRKYAEPKMMFRNTGRGIFENVSDQLGPGFPVCLG